MELTYIGTLLVQKWQEIINTFNNSEAHLSLLILFKNEQAIYIMIAIELISQQEAEYIFNAVNRIFGRDAEPYVYNYWQNLVKYSFDDYSGPYIQYN